MTHRRRIISLLGAVSTIAVIGVGYPVRAQPSAAQVLSDLGWTGADQERVLAGEFVTNDVAGASDRDLALSIAFLVKTSPENLSRQIMAGNIIGADSQVQASGEFTGAGNVADLARLLISDDTAQTFLGARAGETLNLSAREIAAFNALQGGSTQAALPQLRQMLLDRFQAYKASGLSGIAPYDRGDRTTDVGDELRKASEAVAELRKYMPDLQQALIDYPHAAVPGMQQSFRWVNYSIDGATTLVLMHELAAADGCRACGSPAPVLRQQWLQRGAGGRGVSARPGGNGGRVHQPHLYRPGRRIRRRGETQHRSSHDGEQARPDIRHGAQSRRSAVERARVSRPCPEPRRKTTWVSESRNTCRNLKPRDMCGQRPQLRFWDVDCIISACA